MAAFAPGVQDCPHCCARVMIVSNGLCPRCQKNARDVSAANLNHLPVWLHAKDEMPEVCVCCSCPATYKAKVIHTVASEDDGNSISKSRSFAAILAGLLFGWIGYLIIRDKGAENTRRRTESIVVNVPVCASCRNSEIQPVGSSRTDATLKIAAHREFVEAFTKINRAA